ncbi:MAG: hypothetical protein V2B19_30935 [Pseudomonadota bacterium]
MPESGAALVRYRLSTVTGTSWWAMVTTSESVEGTLMVLLQ